MRPAPDEHTVRAIAKLAPNEEFVAVLADGGQVKVARSERAYHRNSSGFGCDGYFVYRIYKGGRTIWVTNSPDPTHAANEVRLLLLRSENEVATVSPWRHEKLLRDWSGRPLLTVGEDSDGDVGIIDDNEYSIMFSPESAAELRDWLQAYLDRRKAAHGAADPV